MDGAAAAPHPWPTPTKELRAETPNCTRASTLTRDRAASHTGSSTCWAPGQAARARTHCDSMPTADSLNSRPALVQSCLMILSQHWEARQNYINDGRLTFFGSTFNKDVLFLCHSKVAPKHSLVRYTPRYSINDIFILMVTCSYLPLLFS